MFRLIPTFVTTVFLSLNFGALIYINSTFLGEFFPSSLVTLLFFLGPVLTVTLFFFTTKLVEIMGKGKLLFTLLLILFAATLGLYLATTNWLIAIAFVLYQGILYTAYWCLDIYVEEESVEKYTGELRGIYLTLMNAGIAGGPLLVTILGVNENLRPIYLVATLLLLIPLLISFEKAFEGNHKSVPPTLHRHPIHLLPFRQWWQRRNIRAVSLVKLILEIFFGAMLIYAPVYLHSTLGFTWGQLGIIFTSMLIPFVLLEWPAGELADRVWGEKEMLSIGLFITGTALLIMPFLGPNFWQWLIVLVASRVGAALIEVNADSYFFKKIKPEDLPLISIFRLARPLGIITGSLLGLVIATYLPIPMIFFALAVILFFGLKESLSLVDTL